MEKMYLCGKMLIEVQFKECHLEMFIVLCKTKNDAYKRRKIRGFWQTA